MRVLTAATLVCLLSSTAAILPVPDLSGDKNDDTVRKIYDAFNKGDLDGVLEYYADDIQWDQGKESYGLEVIKPRSGKAAIATYLNDLVASTANMFLEVIDTYPNKKGNVIGHVHFRYLWKDTGRVFNDGFELHVWKFNDEGKVASFNHVLDTRGMTAALTNCIKPSCSPDKDSDDDEKHH